MKYFLWTALVCLLSACIAVPTPVPTNTITVPSVLVSADNPYVPLSENGNLPRANVELTSINLIERVDLNPIRVEVDFTGSLPTTCNLLQVEVGLPNDQYEINIKIYSIVESSPKCEQVVRQFDANILLGVYSVGRYIVLVNDGFIGDFVVY